jgi:hypothetical protein
MEREEVGLVSAATRRMAAAIASEDVIKNAD